MLTMSPKLGDFITKVTRASDIETALWKVVSEYLDLKSKELDKQIGEFSRKWGMSFEEFSKACKRGTIGKDPYSYEVEKDFWEWERIHTLKRHYDGLGAQWM